jgi:predicted secreted hydrolase
VRRREFLALGVVFPFVRPGHRMQFPRDHGAHPEFRIEWWYVTGWLAADRNRPLGFQITFFRVRPEFDSANPSAFAPRQILLAHAALSDPRHGRLRHDERAARAALGLAGASEETTSVWVDDWRLDLSGDLYESKIVARDFALDLKFEAGTPPLPQGENGLSRKGHRPEEASYYYSRPQLRVTGAVDARPVTGAAWLDHEWSSQYLAPEAAGWDWCGINLDDGGSLMAFRVRDRQGGTHFAPPGVSFKPLRWWKSPRTGVSYPVSMQANDLTLEPLMDDQELDARASTGTIYWEGAVSALRSGRPVGKGYLELTGYWKPMRL